MILGCLLAMHLLGTFLGDAEMVMVVNRLQEQLRQIKTTLDAQNLTNQQILEATQLTAKLTEGIDQEVELLTRSDPSLKAILQSQKKEIPKEDRPFSSEALNRRLTEYRRYFPDQLQRLQDDELRYRELQRNIANANDSDEQDYSSVDRHLLSAKPAEIPKWQTEIEKKNGQVQLRISTQLGELTDEMRVLRQEFIAQNLGSELGWAQLQEASHLPFSTSSSEESKK